ncbi:MAG: YihY/virulence factor BrkB family protein [Chloroflexota bacterium]|nr:YihY/virulence factor BrkB family protein [Chloroflexota bacterium]
MAAALAFYALISLFPLLLAGAAVASWFVDPAWAVARITHLLGEFLPSGEVEVEAIVGGAIAQRGRVGLISVLVLLVSGRRVLGALTRALNRVSDVDERRDGLLRRAAVELAMLAGVGALFGLALSSGPMLALLWRVGDDASWFDRAAAVGALAVVRGTFLVATFFLVYYFVPRGQRDARAALAGAVAAALLFLVARGVFLLSVDRLWSSVSLVYGPLAVGAVLLLWAWYAALITLFGGSLASHVKVMLVEGRSAAEAGRRHAG